MTLSIRVLDSRLLAAELIRSREPLMIADRELACHESNALRARSVRCCHLVQGIDQQGR
jgi:hypothetical protein